MWKITLKNQHNEIIDLGTFDGSSDAVSAEAEKRADKYADKSGMKITEVIIENG